MKLWFKKRPAFIFVIMLAFGIILERYQRPWFNFICWTHMAILSMVLYRLATRRTCSMLIMILFLTTGFIYAFQRDTFRHDHIYYQAKYYRNSPVMVKGIVVSDVEDRYLFQTRKHVYYVRLKKIQSPWGWKDISGYVLVNDFSNTQVEYGDLIQIGGKLHRPFNFSKEKNFSYQEFLRNKDVYFLLTIGKSGKSTIVDKRKGFLLRQVSISLRNKFKGIFDQFLTANESGIMKAMLLGDRSWIPNHIRQLFINTGTAHVLAISGLHVGVIAASVMILLGIFPLGRPVKLTATMLSLIFYIMMTGGRPSVLRAGIIIIIFLLSCILEREGDSLNTLSVAAFIILMMNPFMVFDIGFQLSFVCVLGIIAANYLFFMNDPAGYSLKNHCSVRHIQWIKRSLIISSSIWIMVSGLIAYYFNVITPITVIVNLIVVPWVSLIVVFGVVLLLAGLCHASIAIALSACLKVLLNGLIVVIYCFQLIPGSSYVIKGVTLWHIIIYYILILLGLTALIAKKVKKRRVLSIDVIQ